MFITQWINALFADPKGILMFFLLAMPGRLLAISAHEFAHAYIANKCGDPTARLMGRMTINPLKHLDLLGTLMMLFIGFGWAKPVPVNPRNYKGDYRKADLKVSIAGIAMNLTLFLISAIALYTIIGFALSGIDTVSEFVFKNIGTNKSVFFTMHEGAKCVMIDKGDRYVYWIVQDMLTSAPNCGELIQVLWGNTAYYLFEMLSYFMQVNIVLAVFNLFPIPPLDGYHVLNDLVLKRDLFADMRAQRVGNILMLVLMFSGVLSQVLNFIIDKVYLFVGSSAGSILSMLGVL